MSTFDRRCYTVPYPMGRFQEKSQGGFPVGARCRVGGGSDLCFSAEYGEESKDTASGRRYAVPFPNMRIKLLHDAMAVRIRNDLHFSSREPVAFTASRFTNSSV